MESPPQREPVGLQKESPPQKESPLLREPEKLQGRASAPEEPEGLQKESPLQRGAGEAPKKSLRSR